MSKSAWALLFVALASFLAAMSLPQDAAQGSALLGTLSAVSGTLFLLALFKGRKIKFDPLLR
ncbi:MAG: hypothetical protein PW845_00320 [Pseudomonas sp.]|uniref:PA3371 family protein n=1 Tax=Pseudomonas abieticivorans TaxID=2931382 RepID=UPI0020C02DB7|nr:PA3371 family protein [Pseudomonas sp. PIA16]MDE1163845.1 hypothetical protein [Pseudomonas sp.]